MKDEQFVYYQDVKEKKTTSRSARNKRTHGMLDCDAVTHWMPLPSTEGVE